MSEIVMPDLVSPYAGFRHTHRSAIETLRTAGLPDSRIRIRLAGAVARFALVVAQDPAPFERITENVTLTVAGRGMFHHLPYGMRWSGPGFGLKDLAGVFDDPQEKARLQVAEGVRLFAIGADADDACCRWIRLFGLDPEAWPAAKRHSLSILLPSLHRIAGTSAGIRRGLEVLLDLPLLEIREVPCFLKLPEAMVLRPGKSGLQLGIDTFLSDRMPAPSELQFVIGPVSLDVFNCFQREDDRALLDRTLKLLVPFSRRYTVQWSVLDRSRAPRLGDPSCNSTLGVNTHLGQAADA